DDERLQTATRSFGDAEQMRRAVGTSDGGRQKPRQDSFARAPVAVISGQCPQAKQQLGGYRIPGRHRAVVKIADSRDKLLASDAGEEKCFAVVVVKFGHQLVGTTPCSVEV